MTDTTEQAVTVAQEDREAAAKLFGFPAWENIMYVEDRATSERVRAAVLAFARHRLASVSSASAEIPAGMKPWTGGDNAPDDWDGGSVLRADGQIEHSDDITIPQWRHLAPGYKLNIVAYTPARVLDLPEPVPATNQAGEVKAWLYQREGCASVVAKNAHRWANADGWVETPLIAALATQPATSQDGERFTSWSTDTLADQCRMQARDQLDPEFSSFLAEVADRLAATPTPPTLSEDLREAIASELPRVWTDFLDANPDDLTSPEDMPDHAYMTGQQFEDWALEAFDRAALALAQVKAS